MDLLAFLARGKMKEPTFSFYDFKKWLDENTPSNEPKIVKNGFSVGESVQSRIGIKRLEHQLNKDNSKLENVSSLAQDFKNNGGKILEIDEVNFLIEVKNGKFLIPKIYVK